MASSPHASRPLSPHLSIYRFHLSMVLSITHRIASMVVSGLVALVIVWLWAAAYSEPCFAALHDITSSTIGQGALVLASFVFFLKLGTGMRHLVWDTGAGFRLPWVGGSGRAAIAFAILATALTWAIVWEVI